MAAASSRPPTAEGRLEKTPIVHLLVYVADRRLTGSMSFAPPGDGAEPDVIHFQQGAPVKFRTGRPVAYLGEVLVDLGAITEDARDASLASAKDAGELHGEFLVKSGAIDRQALAAGLHEQAIRKAAHIFAAPADTAFCFFEGEDLLQGWGGADLRPLDPLHQVWLAVGATTDTRILDATLARLGSTLLKVHPQSPVQRFGFGRQELRVVTRIRAQPVTLGDLIATQVAPERVVRSVVYALLVTRHLDHGSSVRPVALDWGDGASGSAPLSAQVAARREAILHRSAEIEQEDYFQMLGVPRDATADAIKTAFLAFVKVWHTDRLGPEFADVRDVAAKVFARTNAAFETLSNPARRQQYLETLSGTVTAEDEENAQVEKILEAAKEYQHAEVFFKKHDLAKAEECCARACELDAEQSDYLGLSVAIQLEKRALDASVADLIPLLDAVIAKNDKSERAYFTRAKARKRLGQTELAIDDFRVAFELNPGNLDAAREVRIYEMRKSRQPFARGGPEPGKAPSSSPVRRLSGFIARSLSSLPAMMSPTKSPSSGPGRSPSNVPGRSPSNVPGKSPSSVPGKSPSSGPKGRG
jgi:tetratricopeptide (TPR) repeat protein